MFMLQGAHAQWLWQPQSTDSLFSIAFVCRAATASHQKIALICMCDLKNYNVKGKFLKVCSSTQPACKDTEMPSSQAASQFKRVPLKSGPSERTGASLKLDAFD